MNTQMNLQRIPVERLKPAKYNPRKDLKPGDLAYEKIRRSLHDFGSVSYTHLDVYKRQVQAEHVGRCGG